MRPGLLLAIPLALTTLAALSPAMARRIGRDTGYVLAAAFAAGTGLLIWAAPGVIAGEPLAASLPWIPSLGLELSLRLDGLGLLFGVLVLGVGALVMAYSARYLSPGKPCGRLYGMLTLFAASMLGLVLADDIFALFVFWELTSITSFFLIGGDGVEGRAPALRAFLVTAAGGLALLAGLVLLSLAGGSTSLAEILADPATVRDHALAPAIIVLVLLGAFTKSAQVPFHFWLPGAMVAPTPVSTYLHAATMVKAGLYLMARLSPLFAELAMWRYPIIAFGLATAVYGAAVALKQNDLKSLLAYSTVSQLGFIAALIGVGTAASLAAAAAHTIAHALYKATLFMVVGIIDKEAGSRDIRRLSGLRKMMPLTAAVTGFAGLSMAGFPPFLGFVSKEASFEAFLHAPGAGWLGPAALVLAVGASIMTFAYGARIFDGAFGGPPRQDLFEPRRSFIAPAALPALGGLALGGLLHFLDPFVSRITSDAIGAPFEVHLTLWHGLTPALYASMITVAAGFGLFVLRDRVDRGFRRVTAPATGPGAFDALVDRTIRLGRRIEEPFLSRRPAAHLAWVYLATVALGLAAWAAYGARTDGSAPPTVIEDWAIAALLGVAAVGVAIARRRLAAVALIGIGGFLVASLYVVLGAPDLAITQLLVETLTVALIVLVFRKLPSRFTRSHLPRRAGAAIAAGFVGLLAALTTFALAGRREISEAGAYFLEAAPADAGGDNVVNTILVDFRALDTLGEITVLAVAAIGVFALVRLAKER